MRSIFGLVGILVVLGVIVWWMGSGGGLAHTQQVIKTGDKAREQMNQVAGNDATTGARASESAELEALSTGGKLNGILVSKVTAGGAYEKYFGLKRNDTVIAIVSQGNRQDMRDFNQDSEMAIAQISEAYQRKGSLVVMRDDKELTLPAAKSAAAPKKSTDGGGLDGQFDAIRSSGGGK